MWYDGLFESMENCKDDAKGEKMAAYMKYKFPFLGIQKPKLNALIKPCLKEGKKLPFDWKFVFTCWDKPYREAQYVGVDYLMQNRKKPYRA